MHRNSGFLRDSLLLTLTSLGASALGGIVATYSRTDGLILAPIVVAWLCNLASLLPAVAARNWRFFQAPYRHLAALVWRFPVALGSLLIISWWHGTQRICFIGALLTCYFVTLLLESWLQIRQSTSQD